MKLWEHRLVAGGLILAGVLFLVAAARPAISGHPVEVAFLLVGLVSLVLGIVAWRHTSKRNGRPSA